MGPVPSPFVEFTVAEVARATGGSVHGGDAGTAAATVVTGVGTDTRTLTSGELFVAIVAGRDGHDFVAEARQRGAAACVCDRVVDDGCTVVVADTQVALADLGAVARDRLGWRVAGITGSVGKTSTKDLAASVLGTKLRTVASERSFNNELGVPLTLLGAPADTEATVVEMGMRGFGHISRLCQVARPTLGVVTSVAMVHTEAVGDLDGVARAKGELVEALPASGHAVLNAGDPRVAAMADRTDAEVVRYGTGGDVVAEEVRLGNDLRPSFRLVSPWGAIGVRVAARGLHQVDNALAAATVGLIWGVDPAGVAEGLATAALSPWRMEVAPAVSGATVINDAYNAGPASMEAALRSLAALGVNRRVAVMGTMAELGPGSNAEHERIARIAVDLGIEVVAVGEPAYGGQPGVVHVPTGDAAVAWLGDLGDGDAVLVKASRSVGLEVVAAALLGV
jgi:UDP-N-acetylmuramoyl-tripeptide--D-alanyl-D-alanine ligase